MNTQWTTQKGFKSTTITAHDGTEIGYIIDPDHAAFIVRAVNTHAQLLEALKALLCEPMAERTVDAAKRAIRAAQGKD